MITVGIDCGSKNIRAVVLADGQIAGRAAVAAGMDTAAAARAAFDRALAQAGVACDAVRKVAATGAGKAEAAFHDSTVTEVSADARGAHFLDPAVRTVIDVGAEEACVVKLDANGRLIDFAVNDKCAAGTGVFIEAMARALEVSLEEFGQLSLLSTQPIPINAQCVVFAESEVVGLVHANTPKPDIARAIHDAIADRITSMVRRVSTEAKMALVGGVARNVGFVRSLEEALQAELWIPGNPEFVGALGAAIAAADG